MDDETPGELALIPGDRDSKRTTTTLTDRLRDARRPLFLPWNGCQASTLTAATH
jgi:hypothetical protein